MNTPVFVSGFGAITAAGQSAEQLYRSLVNERTGVRLSSQLQTVHTDIPLGAVSLSNKELAEQTGLSEKYASRTLLLAACAAKEAVLSAGISSSSDFKTAVIVGTTVSGLDTTEHFLYRYLASGDKSNAEVLQSHECGSTTAQLAEYLGFTDYLSTLSTACSSSANAIALGGRLIAAGVVDRAVCGGTDALSLFTVNGFNAMKILDRSLCRPFDAERAGLNLGEGAAFLVLESENSLLKSKKTADFALAGWGNRCDAFHQTATSPDGRGAYLAMRDALMRAKLQPDAIDYINTHGTGTNNNDETELVALQRLFGSAVPPFSSTKVYTGHTLGAAGAVESVISLLALRHNTIFPTFTFRTPMRDDAPVPETVPSEKQDIRSVMSNSFGFGGNDTTLIFTKRHGA